MTDYIVRDTQLTSVANAIRTKGGTNNPMAFPDGFVSAVEAILTGGGSSGGPVVAKEVNFRDYDGTVVYSYTPAEFAALTAMPDNPDRSHDAVPLTSQGWNWNLAKAQAYVAKYGRLEVGQMYATADGKTHVLIHLEQGRTSPMLGCCPNGTVDVDWGDGTAHDTLTGTSVTEVQWTPTHNYAMPGDYDIKLTCTGMMGFYGSSSSNQYSGLLRYTTGADNRNRVYQNAIQAMYCASNATSIEQYAFSNCCSLSSITIPDGITSIDVYAFSYCYSLSSITIPDSVTSIEQYMFYCCYNLSSITIPQSMTSIGTNAFTSCYSLSNITIPESMTSIGDSTFTFCYSLSSVTFPQSMTSIGSSVFNGCYVLSTVTFPQSMTSIEQYMFYNCYSLSNVTIPEYVTSIGSNAFYNCRSLSNITIPEHVTSINNNAFYNCFGLAELHFLSSTPPTIPNANAFTGIPTDCKIYVPAGCLEAYTSATNYKSSSTYTYIEE